MSKKKYDNRTISIFPKGFSMELPDGYRIDTEYNDDFNETYHLRGGFYINDDGNEDFAFTCSFITLNVDLKVNDNSDQQAARNLRNPAHPDFAFNQVMEGVKGNLEEQFGEGKYINLFNSLPVSAIMKFYQPFTILGVTLDTYLVFYWIEVNENTVFGFNSAYRNNPGEVGNYHKHLLNVIKSVRVNGKAVDTGKLTPKKLEKALDLDVNEDVDSLDLGLSAGINFKNEDEETSYTLNSDGSISEENVDNGIKYASPREELYPHYNSKLRFRGLGMLGVNVVVNQTGTEYKFYNLKDDLDDDISDEMKNAVSQLNDTGASKYTLADRAKEMMPVFHVSPEVFDTAHDRECELQEGMLHRAYMMSALRSFAWTMAKCCGALKKKPAALSLEQIRNIIDTIADANWLNYDNKSVCKGLCGTQDLHVYYLPDNTPERVKAVFKPSQEEIEQTKQIQERFPDYNPILSEIGSLDKLRKDLEYIYPAIEKIYEDLKSSRNYSEALIGNDADILYAWCALSYAARGPFFTEDGPTSCWFTQTVSREERRAAGEKERKKLGEKRLEKNDIVQALDDIRDHWKATESVRLGLMEYFDKMEAREKKEKAERKKNKKKAAAAGKSDDDIINMYVVLCNEEKAKIKGMTSSKFYKLYEDFFPAFTKDELWNARKDMLAKMQNKELCKGYEDSFRERSTQDRFNIATKGYFRMAMDVFHNSTLCSEDAVENTSDWFNADEMSAVQQLMNNELISRNNRITEQFSWAEPDWMKYSMAKENLEIQIDDYNERKELVSDDCKMFQVKLDAAGGPFLVAAVLRQNSFMPLAVNVMDDCTHYWGVSQSEIWETAFRNNVRNTSDASFNEKQYARDAMRIAKSNYPDTNEIKRIRKEESEKKVGKFVKDIKELCESSDSIKASDVKKALKNAFSNASELADYKEKLAEAASKEKLEFISAILSGQEEAQDLYDSLSKSLANEINNIIREKILAEKDAKYAKAINLSDSNDMKDLMEAKEVFASLGLFKDAKALEKQCETKIDNIKTAQFDEALALRADGSEESIHKAINILTELGTFNAANEKVKDYKNELDRRSRLEEIKTLSQSESIGDLSKAITMLEEFRKESANAEALINHCSNKLERIKEERYAQAISLAEEGTEDSIKSAIHKMDAIKPYKDSAEKIEEFHEQLHNEGVYKNAVALMASTDINDLVAALGFFENLANYKDASDKRTACDARIKEISESLYMEGLAAERVYSLKSQKEAISKFNQLGDYKDSYERKNKCDENCKTIRAILDLNKEIEGHKKELAAITGSFKKKERQAKESLIGAKEKRVNELKDKLTGRTENEKTLTVQKKTEEEKLAEVDVIESPVNTASSVAASVSSSAVKSEHGKSVASFDNKDVSGSPEPKKKGESGIIIAVILIIAALAVVGWLAANGRLGSISQDEDTYVEEEVVQEITPAFTEANILSIEEIGREMYEEGDGIFVHYKVTNNSDSDIWYLGFSNRYYDKSGNILGENGGSYSGILAPSKFAYITDSPYFEEENYDEIDTIEVTKYYYNIENQSYDINLRTNELDSYSGAIEDQKNVDYASADIVSMTLGDTLTLKDGNYVVDVSATNNGKEPLKNLSIYIEFYDENGNSLARESVGGLDITLEPGKTVNTLGYCWSDYADQAKSFAIVDYEYELNKKDQNGYNHYTINKNVECAYGMEW